MQMSEQINELAAALSKFQGEDIQIFKDSQGYGYKYAQFSQITGITRPLLSKHALAVSQLCSYDNASNIANVNTILMHSSGQWISEILSSDVIVTKGMSKAQSIGATLSYLKRYGWCGMIGIEADKDTDAAIEHKAEEHKPEPVAEQISIPLAVLRDLCKSRNVSESEISGWLSKAEVGDTSKLSHEQMSKIIDMLKKRSHVNG